MKNKISQVCVQMVNDRIVVKNKVKDFAETLFMTAFLIKAIAKTNKRKPEYILDILKSALSNFDNSDGIILLDKIEGQESKLQNQKAIECLKEVREKIFEIFEKIEFNPNQCGEYYENYVTTRLVGDIIDNKIKELEGEKE